MNAARKPHEKPIDIDLRLVARVVEGDRHAFRFLVERWSPMVFSLTQRMTGDAGIAEELAQETFLRAFERLREFDGRSKFSTWLYAVGRNLCLDHLKRVRPAEVAMDDADATDGAAGPEECATLAEVRRDLQARLAALPPLQREAFLLREVEGLEYEEIAARCETTVGNVKVRVHRAREALVKRMESHDEP